MPLMTRPLDRYEVSSEDQRTNGEHFLYRGSIFFNRMMPEEVERLEKFLREQGWMKG